MTVVRVLGDMSMVDGPRRIDADAWGGRTARLVLTVLALRPGPVHHTELSDIVWDGEPPESADTALRVAVNRIRTALRSAESPPAEIRRHPGAYELVLPEGSWVDARRAVEQVASARSLAAVGDLAAAQASVLSAVDELARPVGLDSCRWLDLVRERQRADRVDALETAGAILLQAGDPAGAVHHASVAVELAPLREATHRGVMQALAATGDRRAALQAYQRCRRMLRDELGLSPTGETEAVYRALLGTVAPAEEEPADVLVALVAVRMTGTTPDALAQLVADLAEPLGGLVREGVAASAHRRIADALDLAVAVLVATGEHAEGVSVGVHLGAAGAATAARAVLLANAARPGQIVLSSATADVARPHLREAWRLTRVAPIRLDPTRAPDAVAVLEVPGASRAMHAPRSRAGTNLTDQRLFGRGADVDALLAAIDARSGEVMVLCAGAPGVGKSALVAQVGQVLATRCSSGVWHVDVGRLPAHADATAIARAACAVLRVDDGLDDADPLDPPDPVGRIAEALHGAPAVLLLDGIDQHLDAALELAERVREWSSDVAVVATSRRRPNDARVRAVALGALAGPDAVALLRAEIARVGGQVPPIDDPAVLAICDQLRCSPLGLVAAASFAVAMSSDELAAHLGAPDAVLRLPHPAVGTLRRAVESSWAPLTPAERQALCAAPLDPEGFTARGVAGLDATEVIDLVRVSMLEVIDGPSGERRVRVPGIVADFVAEVLAAPTGSAAAP